MKVGHEQIANLDSNVCVLLIILSWRYAGLFDLSTKTFILAAHF